MLAISTQPIIVRNPGQTDNARCQLESLYLNCDESGSLETFNKQCFLDRKSVSQIEESSVRRRFSLATLIYESAFYHTTRRLPIDALKERKQYMGSSSLPDLLSRSHY
jgi:hypothetical protein